MSNNKLTHLVLSNGDSMPSVGFGMWKIEK